MKRIAIVFGIFMLVFNTSCQSSKLDIAEIPDEITSTEDLNVFIRDNLKKQFGTQDVQLGKIFSVFDGTLHGEVKLTYVKNKNEVYEVTVDTHQNHIINIHYLGKNSKVNPGSISFDKWNITSVDAIEITKDLFSANKEFTFQVCLIFTNNNNLKSDELWEVKLTDTNAGIEYWSSIDPYSGEVVSYGSR